MPYTRCAFPVVSTDSNPLLIDQLLAPADLILDSYLRQVYRDDPLNDARFVRLGVRRVLSQSASGRDFLQQTREMGGEALARSSFFDSLHSRRRRDMLAQLNTELVLRRGPAMEDLVGKFPVLKHRRLYAVDGHHLAHACHATRDADQEHVSTNSLYILCLHRGLMMNLGAVQGEGVRRHEMPVFQQRVLPWLERHGGGRGARLDTVSFDER